MRTLIKRRVEMKMVLEAEELVEIKLYNKLLKLLSKIILVLLIISLSTKLISVKY